MMQKKRNQNQLKSKLCARVATNLNTTSKLRGSFSESMHWTTPSVNSDPKDFMSASLKTQSLPREKYLIRQANDYHNMFLHCVSMFAHITNGPLTEVHT